MLDPVLAVLALMNSANGYWNRTPQFQAKLAAVPVASVHLPAAFIQFINSMGDIQWQLSPSVARAAVVTSHQ